MHTTSSYENGGSKIAKIAIVTLLHVGVALALLQMRMAPGQVPDKGADVILIDPTTPIVPEPEPEPVIETPPTVTPPVFVPFTEVPTVAPPPTPAVTTTSVMPTHPAGPIEGPAVIAPPPLAQPVKPAEKKIFEAATAGNCAVPNYPAASARNGDTGTVGLALLIASDGRVADAKVISSSGFRELDRAAIAALSMCKFKPASTNGVPESAWGKIAYVWTLD